MRHETENACDFIDSAIFSGDEFMDLKHIEELEHYIARWQRELTTNKALITEVQTIYDQEEATGEI